MDAVEGEGGTVSRGSRVGGRRGQGKVTIQLSPEDSQVRLERALQAEGREREYMFVSSPPTSRRGMSMRLRQPLFSWQRDNPAALPPSPTPSRVRGIS